VAKTHKRKKKYIKDKDKIKKGAFSKEKCQYYHSRTQFAKRFNLLLTNKIREQFLLQIRFGQAEMLDSQSKRIQIYRVQYKETFYEIVYDAKRNTIVTVLPKSYAHDLEINFTPEMEQYFLGQFDSYSHYFIERISEYEIICLINYYDYYYLVTLDHGNRKVIKSIALNKDPKPFMEVFLTKEMEEYILSRINTHQAQLLEKEGYRSVWEIKYDGQWFQVECNNYWNQILTIQKISEPSRKKYIPLVLGFPDTEPKTKEQDRHIDITGNEMTEEDKEANCLSATVTDLSAETESRLRSLIKNNMATRICKQNKILGIWQVYDNGTFYRIRYNEQTGELLRVNKIIRITIKCPEPIYTNNTMQSDIRTMIRLGDAFKLKQITSKKALYQVIYKGIKYKVEFHHKNLEMTVYYDDI